jgi:hypothetical protein
MLAQITTATLGNPISSPGALPVAHYVGFEGICRFRMLASLILSRKPWRTKPLVEGLSIWVRVQAGPRRWSLQRQSECICA